MILLRRLLTTLSRKSQVLPNALFVEGVSCGDRNAINGGGYADIYRGELDGRVVALKRLRTFTSMSPESESKIVSLYVYLECVLPKSLEARNVLQRSPGLAQYGSSQHTVILGRGRTDISSILLHDILVARQWYYHGLLVPTRARLGIASTH